MYSKKVLKYFFHPKNVGIIKNPTVKVTEGSLACGDMVTLYLKIDKVSRKIVDIKFKSYGCAANIATMSFLTELVKGKTIESVEKLTYKMLEKELGGLPPAKTHCSLLAIKSLKSAIRLYKEKMGEIEYESIDKDFVMSRLRSVIHPAIGKDIVSSGLVAMANISDGKVNIKIRIKEKRFRRIVLEEIKERFCIPQIKKISVEFVDKDEKAKDKD
ncbi:MAG TPA: iron-sulfur cluster assembly scaffold protein [Candidatus Aenigmarchaeota archaeon]|nr:MAG: iron-sulfur cluster assembly scaffold protein [Candidatus Aenigmarchaeota archaeon]HDD46424.1 iron-sulfur cluster assembly scaffold protein [Candidatus Aenigmarchaeota archaeon]